MNEIKNETIELRKLDLNKGQVEGLPKNPRFIRDERYKALVKSIKDAPEMLHLRELLVYPHGKKYVVIGGNMRLRACKELGMESVPCKILPQDTPVEKLREYTIKDNNGFGQDDWDLLANEWEAEELTDWGMEIPTDWGDKGELEDDGGKLEDDGGNKENYETDDEVEKLLDEAMKENIAEYVKQVELTMQHGFLETGLTRGYAKAQFIKALYYGGKYPNKCAYVYAPELYQMRGGKNSGSYLDAMYNIISGGESGLAGLRTMTRDGKLTRTISNSYRVASCGVGSDFPAEKARDIIMKYGGEGCKVLDPCHGWGGRLIGAMLAGVREYYGCDPSPIANRAVSEIYSDFKGYCHTRATLIKMPYERITEELPKDFDMAFTSPPYFDVEIYAGENTSTTLYPEFEGWCRAFFAPLIVETVKRLKKGGVFMLQVGSQSYPLREKAMQICRENGLTCEVRETDIFQSPLGTEDRSDKEELLMIRNHEQ